MVAEMKAPLKASHKEMMAQMKVHHEEIMAIMGADRGKTKAYPEKREAIPEEMKYVAEHQEVPKEEAAVDTIGAPEDQHGDRRLAVRRLGQPKKQTHGDGGSRKKLAAARRRMTHHAVSARRKEGSHKGPTVEKRNRRVRNATVE
jgi:hypothetical protein